MEPATDVRRSDRDSKGVPPERLGVSTVPPVVRKPAKPRQPGNTVDDARSVRSHRSTSSKVSAVSARRKRQAELDASESLAELEDEEDEIEAEVLLEQKRMEQRRIQADLQRKKIERQKKLTHQKLAMTKAEIEDDETSSQEGEEQQQFDQAASIRSWLDNVSQRSASTTPSEEEREIAKWLDPTTRQQSKIMPPVPQSIQQQLFPAEAQTVHPSTSVSMTVAPSTTTIPAVVTTTPPQIFPAAAQTVQSPTAAVVPTMPQIPPAVVTTVASTMPQIPPAIVTTVASTMPQPPMTSAVVPTVQQPTSVVSTVPTVSAMTLPQTFTVPSVSATPAAAVVLPKDEPPPTIVDQLANMLVQALSKANSDKTVDPTNNKFIARQTTAKDMPYFYGEPEEWPNFIAEFRSATENCGFTNFENMARLRKCLKGKARDSVLSMMVVPDNVEKVISTLQMNFGRPEFIIEKLMRKAKASPSVKEDKPETIVDFSNDVRNIVYTMENLSETGNMHNPQLLAELVAKLPASFRLHWGSRKMLKPDSNLKDLSTWLEELAIAASYIRTYSSYADVGKPKEDRRSFTRERRESVMTTTGEESPPTSPQREKRKSTPYKCLFCDKDTHLIIKCYAFAKETEDKRWDWATDKKICFCCLQKGHQVSFCPKKANCGKDGCRRPHHPLLHKPEVKKPEEAKTPEEKKSDESHPACVHTKIEKSVLLHILPVKLRGPAGIISTYAMLDDGSTVTLVDSSIAKKLGAFGRKEKLKLQWTNSITRIEPTQIIELFISGANGEEFKINNVFTRERLDLPMQTVNVPEIREKFDYIPDGYVDSMENAIPTILIGKDNTHLIMNRDIIEGPPDAPVLTNTKLGWAIHGNVKESDREPYCKATLYISQQSVDDKLYDLVKQSFSTDNFGIMPLKTLPQSVRDLRAREIIDATTRRVEDRWETGLLWKSDTSKLPESKRNAVSRLEKMERKMDHNSVFAEEYCSKIEDYVAKGYARKLTPAEAATTDDRTWYIPHFGVTNPNKPGKLRLVFDAAARSHGGSLNDELLSGPDQLTPLIRVLMKFRQWKVGFGGDIREMFHQVRIREEDRTAQRFLWRGMDREKEPETFAMNVMTFGATCSPCLAQEVKNRNAREYIEEYPEAVKAITDRHYVDDYLDSAPDEETAIKRIKEVTEIHQKGGFHITSWISSSKSVLSEVNAMEASQVGPLRGCGLEDDSKNLELEKTTLPTERVLGLTWNPNTDCFGFTLNFHKVKRKEIADGSIRPTKREVLQLTASIYDPLGFIAFFTMKPKTLLQDIWRSGIGWDDEISDIIFYKWKLWLEELKGIRNVSIPRCYSVRINSSSNIQLHLFCDASEREFADVGFLRIDTGGSIDLNIVAAKTKVAPLKPLSIPRLELQAAVMGSRHADSIKISLELTVDNVHFWSDSRSVLYWIRSDARNYPPFVAHRIGEIQELTEISTWHWIPSGLNVADDATRDNKPAEFHSKYRWFCGPEFLLKNEEDWPQETKKITLDDFEKPEELELKAERVYVHTIPIDSLMDINRTSSWRKLLRVTAWQLRFMKNIRILKKDRILTPLTPGEICRAEELWWKQAQNDSFPDEIADLTAEKPIQNSSRLITHTPYMDQRGVMRLKGRTEKSPELDDKTKYPVILDSKHRFTKLMLQFYHERFNHTGQETVVNEIRQKYLVLNLRTAVRSTWSSCIKCKIDRAKPQAPLMGALPEFRLEKQCRPFVITGLDYFGPMDVTIGRRREKRYGALFTCLTTRAVHIEIAHSLTTDSCIMAIRRFVARRGTPKAIYSDNGTNFRGAATEIKKALEELDQKTLTEEMTEKGIEWHFIPPSAPHFGGCWERLVKSIKTALKTTLKERAPREETLMTIMAEAEFTVNCHPLTHVPVDPDDKESLTPNDFLLGSSGGYRELGKFDNTDLYLRKQWRIAQRLADNFWTRWVREYLPSLNRRMKWNKNTKPLQVGDLVIIADDNGTRNSWPRGLVTALYPGKDGIIRAVDVRSTTGTYRRPVAKICVLDLAPEEGKGGLPLLGGSMCSSRPTCKSAMDEKTLVKGQADSKSHETDDDSSVQQVTLPSEDGPPTNSI